MNESDLIIRFLSCSVGQAPAELQRIRQAFGAGEAFAPTCFRVVHTKGPINMTPPKGTPTAITSEAVLQALEQKYPGAASRFERLFDKLLRSLGASAGCVEGVPSGATAAQNRADLRRVYFENGGQLVAVWMSANDLHAPYSAGTTICAKDMPVIDSKAYVPGATGCALVKAT